MKKIGILLAIIFGFASISNAQNTVEAQNDSITKVTNEPRDRFMINLSFDNVFHKETNGFDTKWHSRGVGLYYMYDIPIKNSRVSIAPGLGFRHSSLYHNSFMTEQANSEGTIFTAIPDYKDNDDYKKHKLATNYFEVPVELRFFSKPSKKGKVVKAALGFRGSIKLTAVNKETNKENGYYKKYKTKGYKDVNLFQGGPTFRVGYGGFNIFAYYGVVGVFKKDKGPDLTPFSIGI